MNKKNPIKKINTPKPKLMLAQIIYDFLGKDEKIMMFKKHKNKVYMFVVNSKSLGKIISKEDPQVYPIDKFENLGMFLYKLNREKK